MGMEQFYTLEKANEGVKLPLVDPETGEKSEHWIKVYGGDSDVYRKAESAYDKEKVAINAMSEEEREDALFEAHLKFMAKMVFEWSFPEDCKTENVRELLFHAPAIKHSIDSITRYRKVFFALRSDN